MADQQQPQPPNNNNNVAHHQNSPTPQAAAPPSVIVSDNPYLSNAINLADKIRSKVTQYPYPVRTEPPLPHGFVEGALVGLTAYMFFWPVRAQAMKWVGQSAKWSATKPYVGIFCTAGQALVGAKAALYTAVLVGSKAWLETLGDFAATPPVSILDNPQQQQHKKQTHQHKRILADELCQDDIVRQTTSEVSMQSENLAKDTTKHSDKASASLMDWVRDPEDVVVQELFRAVRKCQDRKG